jgi:hypothetical protein
MVNTLCTPMGPEHKLPQALFAVQLPCTTDAPWMLTGSVHFWEAAIEEVRTHFQRF